MIAARRPVARHRSGLLGGHSPLICLLLLLTSCYRAAARSHPFPGAIQATTARGVREAASAALATFNDNGIDIEQFRPDTGLVESAWFDVAALVTSAHNYPPDERSVRFRFLAVADSMGSRVRLYLEVVQHGADAFGGRRQEREAPGDHPAMDLARRMMQRVTDRLGR